MTENTTSKSHINILGILGSGSEDKPTTTATAAAELYYQDQCRNAWLSDSSRDWTRFMKGSQFRANWDFRPVEVRPRK